MAKPWGKMTAEEKLEGLRDDMRRIYEAYNQLRWEVGNDQRKLTQISKTLERLEPEKV